MMSLAFLIVIAKLFSIIIAFSRRKLSRSLELIKRSNQIIFYLSLSIFIIMIINDTVMIVLYLAENDNQTFQKKFADHIMKYSLLEMIVGGCF